MKFDRYMRFFDAKGRSLDFGQAWGVYEYPDGQNQIWFARPDEAVSARVCLNHPALLDLIAQIRGAIGPISLFVTYLYGARSDKFSSGGRAVCNVAARMRQLLAEAVGDRNLSILAPHDGNGFAADFVPDYDPSGYDGVVFPDGSARARLPWLRDLFAQEIVFDKERNQQSAEIVGFKPLASVKKGRYLVADDICDGGATFVKVAERMPGCVLDLAVVHGIFSGGALDRLSSAGYEQIWTTDSYVQHRIEDEVAIRSRCRVQNVW